MSGGDVTWTIGAAGGAGGTFTPVHTGVPSLTVNVKVVETMAGWLGQVTVGQDIVWESRPYKTYKKASRKALAHRARRIAEQFA